MTTHLENRPDVYRPENFRLAIGIVFDGDSELLDATLKSMQMLSDSIFVVTTEPLAASLDETLLQQLGVTVFVSKQNNFGDYSALKNELIDQVEALDVADWILWANCGDCFDPATLEPFFKFVESEIDRNVLYVMVLHRLIHPNGPRHDFDEEVIETRLMPLKKGLRFQGRIKESPIASAEKLMIALNAAPGRFLCPSRFNDSERRKRNAKRLIEIVGVLEGSCEEMKNDVLAFRSEAYAEFGNFLAAQKDCLRLAEETSQENLRLKAYYDLWESFAYVSVSSDDITRVLVAGLDRFPVDMQLLTFMGTHLQRLGQFDLAIRSYETALRHGRISLDVWHRLHIREIAVVSLALTHRLRGDSHEAIRVLEQYLDEIPDKTEYSRHLLDLYVSELQEAKAREFAATMFGSEELDRIRNVLTGACRASAGAWDAAFLPLESAYMNGCRDVMCLRWYSLCLLSLSRFSQAIPILEQWMQADPGNTEVRAFLLAARNPDRFGEIMQEIQQRQMEKLGLSGTDPLQPEFKKPDAQRKTEKIDNALREMVSSSGSSCAGKISIAAFGTPPQNDDFDLDDIEIDSTGDSDSELVFRRN